MSGRGWFVTLSAAATVLALFVVVLGAYVRLSDAGLGCPDWPGCYGHIGVPQSADAVARANAVHPDRPVEVAKGWKEMAHRYVAGVLGLLVLALAAIAWRNRRRPGQPVWLPLALVVVILLQAALGMWTVTWKLKPAVVMAHLLGGLATLSLLWWQTLRAGRWLDSHVLSTPTLRLGLGVGLVVVVAQIALGGWTSANYAALACNEFPTCSLGQYWPPADFAQGFELWHGIGPNYEFAQHIDHPAKVAIHLVHRLGAVVVVLLSVALALALWRRHRGAALAFAGLVTAQVVLGISNVVFSLPLGVAVTHNAGAAILLLTLVTLNHMAHPVRVI